MIHANVYFLSSSKYIYLSDNVMLRVNIVKKVAINVDSNTIDVSPLITRITHSIHTLKIRNGNIIAVI